MITGYTFKDSQNLKTYVTCERPLWVWGGRCRFHWSLPCRPHVPQTHPHPDLPPAHLLDRSPPTVPCTCNNKPPICQMPTHLVQRGRFNFRQQSSNEDGFSRAPVSILIMLTAPLADPWFNLEKNRPSFSDRHLFLRSSEMTRGCSRYFLSVYETMIKKLVFYTISISMGNSKKVYVSYGTLSLLGNVRRWLSNMKSIH